MHLNNVSTHSHPKVAARLNARVKQAFFVSTHSHPKVAALNRALTDTPMEVSTHSHPKVAAFNFIGLINKSKFQHTATRRWLHLYMDHMEEQGFVSTHSHPKVAANLEVINAISKPCFNTQPPEGGCVQVHKEEILLFLFQHTATRRWLLARFSP